MDTACLFSTPTNPRPYQYPHPSPPRLRTIRLRLETRAEFIVVIGISILLVHRRISTLRLLSLALALRRLRRRRLPRHLRVDRRIIAIDWLRGLVLLVHKHLVGQSGRDRNQSGLADSKPVPRQRSKHRALQACRLELPRRFLRQIKNILARANNYFERQRSLTSRRSDLRNRPPIRYGATGTWQHCRTAHSMR